MFGLTFERQAFTGVIMQPGRVPLHNQVSYRFVFGGFLWAMLASSSELPVKLLPCTLQLPGTTAILVREATSMGNLASFANELNRMGRAPSDA
jgi:hypothetical protein